MSVEDENQEKNKIFSPDKQVALLGEGGDDRRNGRKAKGVEDSSFSAKNLRHLALKVHVGICQRKENNKSELHGK